MKKLTTIIIFIALANCAAAQQKYFAFNSKVKVGLADTLGNKVNFLSKSKGFTHMVMQVKGDLNKDGLADLAIVKQDTLADTSPYRLQVFFAKPNGEYKLIVSSTKIIDAEYPSGKGYARSDAGFDKIAIKNNVLTIINQLTRGSFSHKFRYQNGNFELIGFTQTYSDGQGTLTYEDFNLSTGIRIYKAERYDTGDVITNKKTKKLIRPLPKLQDFVPFENEL
ncbi:MAG: hypothetical protein EOP00_11225 [Pedobacter sp.]|nr:MAG: hypothetical protein EOP00_11225 [Pedobacter sp.]